MLIVFNNLLYLPEPTSPFSLRMVTKNNGLSLPPMDFIQMLKPIVNFLYEYLSHRCDKQKLLNA